MLFSWQSVIVKGWLPWYFINKMFTCHVICKLPSWHLCCYDLTCLDWQSHDLLSGRNLKIDVYQIVVFRGSMYALSPYALLQCSKMPYFFMWCNRVTGYHLLIVFVSQLKICKFLGGVLTFLDISLETQLLCQKICRIITYVKGWNRVTLKQGLAHLWVWKGAVEVLLSV